MTSRPSTATALRTDTRVAVPLKPSGRRHAKPIVRGPCPARRLKTAAPHAAPAGSAPVASPSSPVPIVTADVPKQDGSIVPMDVGTAKAPNIATIRSRVTTPVLRIGLDKLGTILARR